MGDLLPWTQTLRTVRRASHLYLDGTLSAACVPSVCVVGLKAEDGASQRRVGFFGGLSSGLFLRRHQQDSDLSVACSDADLHRHKKKKKKKKRHSRKSEDFAKDSEPHLPKAASRETVDRFRRTDGAFPLTDGLPLEGVGPFREKRKHLRMGSRDDRCPLSECGQGKRGYLELRV